MPEHTPTQRTLRLVRDKDLASGADPFAAPTFTPISPSGSNRSGPAPRPLPQAPANTDLDWPSQWWTSHTCSNRRRCPHPMPTPEWWLLMASRGVPYHPDAQVALQKAKDRIRTYKGRKPVLDEKHRLIVQGIVMDALIVAPQPVCPGWVNPSLSAVGGLVHWALENGEPVTREHLLSTHTRNRFLNLGKGGLEDGSQTNYRTRLDLIATALSGVPVQPATTRKKKPADPDAPLTPTEVATLWVWAQGLRPEKRHLRTTACVCLGLGCGLRSSELILVRDSDVTSDSDGVHVAVHGKYGTRIVTCDRVWEDRLLDAVERTPAGHYVTGPWANEPVTAKALQNSLASAQKTYEPPVWFSPRSLRNTWLVNRLTTGTPIPTLLDAAGLESVEALKEFLVFVPTPALPARAASLRD